MPNNFRFEKDGNIATITFNRPERRNCLDAEVMSELEGLVQQVRDDGETRALIITGTGNAFCAGANLSTRGIEKSSEGAKFSKEAGRRLPRLIGRAVEAIAHLECATIAAINGYAVGGGWSLALAFDFCIAVPEAEFWVPEVDMGVAYRGAPAQILAARMGPWRAKEAILECRHYKAGELLAMGLLNKVVEPDNLMPSVRALAESMAKKSQNAIAQSKRDINAFFFGDRLF